MAGDDESTTSRLVSEPDRDGGLMRSGIARAAQGAASGRIAEMPRGPAMRQVRSGTHGGRGLGLAGSTRASRAEAAHFYRIFSRRLALTNTTENPRSRGSKAAAGSFLVRSIGWSSTVRVPRLTLQA